jgi:hypothetical protein
MRLADAETMAIAFLKPFAGTTKVGTKLPNPRPKRFVRVSRTGGAALNRVLERAQLTLTCSAESSVLAERLMSDCREAFLNEYSRMPLVRSVEEITGPYYNPDPDTGEDRYTFTVALTARAAR